MGFEHCLFCFLKPYYFNFLTYNQYLDWGTDLEETGQLPFSLACTGRSLLGGESRSCRLPLCGDLIFVWKLMMLGYPQFAGVSSSSIIFPPSAFFCVYTIFRCTQPHCLGIITRETSHGYSTPQKHGPTTALEILFSKHLFGWCWNGVSTQQSMLNELIAG